MPAFLSNALSRPAVRTALALCLFKIVYFGLIYACLTLLPPIYSEHNFQINFHRANVGEWERYFETWDAAHYLGLAASGYAPGTRSTAFYPLWPALIALFSPLFAGNTLICALVLTNVLSVAALTLLHRLVRHRYSTDLANRTLLLLLASPAAFSFVFPFSESLFLLLSIGIWWLLEMSTSENENLKRGLLIGTLAFLAAATRPTGVLWLVPLAVYLGLSRRWRALPLLAAPLLGFATYFLVLHFATGNAFEGWIQQQEFVSKPAVSKVFDLPGFWKAFFRTPEARHDFLSSPYDRIFFVWFLATLPFLWRLNKAWFAYALVMGLIPAMTVSFMSYLRYVLPLWPCFLVTARWFGKTEITSDSLRTGVFHTVLAGLWGIQILLLIRHLNFYWSA